MSNESREYAAMRQDQNDAERHLAGLTGAIDHSAEYADCVAEELKREDRCAKRMERENDARIARGEEILSVYADAKDNQTTTEENAQ